MMDFSWQQVHALSALILNPEVTRVRVATGTTKKHRGRKGLFAAVWLKGKKGPQQIYFLAKKSTAPKRWRDPITLDKEEVFA